VTAPVYVGALAPERVEVAIDNAALAVAPLDLSTVTAVDLEVRAPAQSFTWPLTITSQTASEIVGYYEFAEGDVGGEGDYRVTVRLTLAAGTRRAGPTVLKVREP
jgi:hypothetical protein